MKSLTVAVPEYLSHPERVGFRGSTYQEGGRRWIRITVSVSSPGAGGKRQDQFAVGVPFLTSFEAHLLRVEFDFQHQRILRTEDVKPWL